MLYSNATDMLEGIPSATLVKLRLFSANARLEELRFVGQGFAYFSVVGKDIGEGFYVSLLTLRELNRVSNFNALMNNFEMATGYSFLDDRSLSTGMTHHVSGLVNT